MTGKMLALAATTALALLSTPPANAQSVAGGQAQASPAAVADARPNVLVWMLDDVGFAQLSCFGGLVQTPNIDRVAKMGLRYTNYHTAPICSASRASLLMGRNPHSLHVGGHVAVPLPVPGADGKIPPAAGTVAANLRASGYRTFALGKWDHLPMREVTPVGPFDHWPTRQGFDRFYGFLAADTDNWEPVLVQDSSAIPTPKTPGYHLNRDLADQAIAMIGSRSALDPAPPFFTYFATGTAHAPHHAPREWIDRYKGKFDMGWDKAREAILKRQIAQGLVPAGAKLAPRPDGMPAWNSLTPDQRRLFARQMEVFAASLSYADEQFGRVLDALEQSGELANTIVMVTSDNGASSEGQFNGTYNEVLFMNGHFPSAAENMPFIDKWGGPETFPHYALGWAVAGNTPFRYFKQTTYEGGTRVPLVVSWPRGIAARGELRQQYVHVTDLAPTILDLADVPLLAVVNNVPQTPMEGTSFGHTLAASDAPGRKRAQYTELYGNKGLWLDGWTIVTAHRLDPWNMGQMHPIDEPWELYNVTKDPGQTTDLAAKYPAKVAELARAFEEQAGAFNVYPLANMGEARVLVGKQMREEFARRGGKWSFPGPVSRMSDRAGPPTTAGPFRLTVALDLSKGDETGPIYAQGGALGGMALYLKGGAPAFMFRDMGGQATVVAAKSVLPKGASTLQLDFDRKRSAPLAAAPARITISADGKPLASETVTIALPGGFGVTETFDIGIDWGSPVSGDYKAGKPFPGVIGRVDFDFNASGE